MILRVVSLILAAMLCAGCPLSDRKANKAKGKNKKDESAAATRDESGDTGFQAFVGRLRVAVQKRDVPTLASMMARDFGYRWDNPPEGETPFAYWDARNLWGELAALLRENWVPHDGFMVAPPQFAASPDFQGYRAGLRMENGSWRFAYFVPPPPASAPAP
jgi:hypothetical protein